MTTCLIQCHTISRGVVVDGRSLTHAQSYQVPLRLPRPQNESLHPFLGKVSRHMHAGSTFLVRVTAPYYPQSRIRSYLDTVTILKSVVSVQGRDRCNYRPRAFPPSQSLFTTQTSCSARRIRIRSGLCGAWAPRFKVQRRTKDRR